MPEGIYCPPVVAANVTAPVVPDQFSPAGIAGFTVQVVVIDPLFKGVNAPSN